MARKFRWLGLVIPLAGLLAAVVLATQLGTGGGSPALAGPGPVTVLPGQGVTFDQVDYLWPGATTLNSSTGEIDVDIATLQAATGMLSGYVNVTTSPVSSGWLVQNLPIDPSYPYPSISTNLDLGSTSGTDVTTLNAYVQFSPTLLDTPPSGAPASFSVGNTGYNAQGVCFQLNCSVGPFVPAPPPAGKIAFKPLGTYQVAFQFGHENVQTAKNQCAPAAYANSLQWLKDMYGIGLKDKNVPGLGGNPANSLVGRLDQTMKRQPLNRKVGDGVFFDDQLTGILSYLAGTGLGNTVNVKYQGVLFDHNLLPMIVPLDVPKNMGNPTGPRNFTAAGLTAQGQGQTVTFQFILNEIKAGEDLKLDWTYRDAAGNPIGAHAVELVGAGYYGNRPWIAYKSDHLQTDDDQTDTQGTKTSLGFDRVDSSYVQDNGAGTLTVIDNDVKATIDSAVAMSPKFVNGTTPVAQKTVPTRTPKPTPTPLPNRPGGDYTRTLAFCLQNDPKSPTVSTRANGKGGPETTSHQLYDCLKDGPFLEILGFPPARAADSKPQEWPPGGAANTRIQDPTKRFWGLFAGTRGVDTDTGFAHDPCTLRDALIKYQGWPPQGAVPQNRVTLLDEGKTQCKPPAQPTGYAGPATTANIDEALNVDSDLNPGNGLDGGFKNLVPAGDEFIFFFAGHGDAVSVRDNTGAAISAAELKTMLSGFQKGVTMTVIIDSCKSGGLIDGDPTGPPNSGLKDITYANGSRVGRGTPVPTPTPNPVKPDNLTILTSANNVLCSFGKAKPTPTPTPTATPTPAPAVGGISLDPQIPGSSGSDAWLLEAIVGTAATVVALGGAAWYTRRRRVR